MSRRSHGIVRTVSVAAVVLASSGQARAAETAVGAYVGTRVVKSDNLTLAEDGGPSGGAAEITTGVHFARTLARLDTHVNYGFEALLYDDDAAGTEIFHQVDLGAEVAIVPNRFFLDAFGIYDQTVSDPTDTIPFSNLTLSNNRADVSIYGLGPRLSLDFGERVEGEVRFTRTWVNYQEPLLLDRGESVGSFTIGSADDQRGGTWNISYDRRWFDYDPFPPVEFEFFTAELGYWVSSTLRLFTIQGLESDYALIQAGGSDTGGPREHFWYAGVEFRPNPRMELELSRGQRSFGESTALTARYRARYGTFTIDYSEEPNTFGRQQVLTARQSGELAPIDALDGPNGDRFYLNKRWDVGYMLQRARSNVGFRFFDDGRFDAATATNDFGAETEHYRGAEFTLVWNIPVVWTMTTTALKAERTSTVTLIDDDIATLTLSFGRRVGRRGELTFAATRYHAEPKDENALGNRWQEDQLSVEFRRDFGATSTGLVSSRYSGFVNANRRF